MLQTNALPRTLPNFKKRLRCKKNRRRRLGIFSRLPINVTSRMSTRCRKAACKFSGDCMSGCKPPGKEYGADELPAGRQKSWAEIFTRVTVRPSGAADRWLVHYQGASTKVMRVLTQLEASVSADIVILAGTFGSFEILLRTVPLAAAFDHWKTLLRQWRHDRLWQQRHEYCWLGHHLAHESVSAIP